MNMRKYKKRTKSTASKTYQDYLNERAKLIERGFNLKAQMSKLAFEQVYQRIKNAKKEGEIKSAPFAYLIRREKYLASREQANALLEAARAREMELAAQEGRKVKHIKLKDIYAMGVEEISSIGQYLTKNKEEI